MSPSHLHYCRHKIHPYVVYGIIPDFRSVNTFRINPPETVCRIPGNTAIISCGMQTSTSSSENMASITLEGFRFKYAGYASRFIELIVSALVTPDKHVAVIWKKCNQLFPGPINAARHSGFEVDDDGDIVRCAGSGKELENWRWFKGHCPDSLYIISSSKPMHDLENAIQNAYIDRMRNPYAHLKDMNSVINEAIECEYAGLDIFAEIGGPDISQFFISKVGAERSFLDGIMSEVAVQTAIPLYYAELDNELYGKGLFTHKCFESHLIPDTWTQVVDRFIG